MRRDRSTQSEHKQLMHQLANQACPLADLTHRQNRGLKKETGHEKAPLRLWPSPFDHSGFTILMICASFLVMMRDTIGGGYPKNDNKTTSHIEALDTLYSLPQKKALDKSRKTFSDLDEKPPCTHFLDHAFFSIHVSPFKFLVFGHKPKSRRKPLRHQRQLKYSETLKSYQRCSLVTCWGEQHSRFSSWQP